MIGDMSVEIIERGKTHVTMRVELDSRQLKMTYKFDHQTTLYRVESPTEEIHIAAVCGLIIEKNYDLVARLFGLSIRRVMQGRGNYPDEYFIAADGTDSVEIVFQEYEWFELLDKVLVALLRSYNIIPAPEKGVYH
jgi:hypothetical protein